MRPSIPTVLRIDIEPDEHQPPVGDRPWDGFGAMTAVMDRLRFRLADLSGHALRPTWMVRLDPDIERAFGRVDFAVHRHADRFDGIRRHGDAVGIHVHAHRWDHAGSVMFSDYADQAWTAHCVQVAAETFAHCFGTPARVASQGGYFMSESVLDAAIALGIEADVTVEPGLAAKDTDPSFGAYASAPSGDFLACPRRPYRPSRRSFAVPAASPAEARPILMVPLTAFDYRSALTPWYRRLSRRERWRQRQHEPLNPWKQWPSPRTFWDLAERAADEGPACYLALALRTDAPETEVWHRVSALLEYLPRHPIARRLRVVDPLAPEVERLAQFPPGP